MTHHLSINFTLIILHDLTMTRFSSVTISFVLLATILVSVSGSYPDQSEVGFDCQLHPDYCSGHGICDYIGTFCHCDEGFFTNPTKPLQCNDFQSVISSPSEDATLGFNCTDAMVDCFGNGVCSQARDTCICNKHYATFNPPAGKMCNYERKNHWAAWGYSFLIAGGAPYYYMEYDGLARATIFFGPIGYIILCFVVGIISHIVYHRSYKGKQIPIQITVPAPSSPLTGSYPPGSDGDRVDVQETYPSKMPKDFFEKKQVLMTAITYLVVSSQLIWFAVVFFQTMFNTIPDGNGIEMV